MEDWQVNLIVGLVSVIFGFISGFFTKTLLNSKNKQVAKGSNINQSVVINEKTEDKR